MDNGLTIQEGNLILDFMGWKEDKEIKDYYWNPEHTEGCSFYNMGYTASWSWLMPVWGKIRQRVWDTFGGYPSEFKELCKKLFDYAIFNEDISLANEVVVEMITWFNQQKIISNE